MAGTLKHWREAATLILAARIRSLPASGGVDYRLLMLQRHRRSKFMPDNYVFPGGTIDVKADFDNGWMDLFAKTNRRLSRFLHANRRQPPLLTGAANTQVSQDIAFRICAIRETFEESGVLLVSDLSRTGGGDQQAGVLQLSHNAESLSKISRDELEQWRRRVHGNASEFIELCRQLNCVPNIWALSEWSRWLTPTDLKPTRFDTMFYVCCVDDIPLAAVDEKEVVNLKWLTPTETLADFKSEKIMIAPPQIYEVGRTLHFKSLDDLHGYSVARADKGVDLWLPIRINATDGIISLFPGDTLYPEKPDYIGEKDPGNIDQSLLESRLSSPHLHRVEIKGIFDMDILCNISLPFGQVPPVSFTSTGVERKSKL